MTRRKVEMPMGGRQFLAAVLADARGLVAVGTLVPCVGRENYEVALVATALLRNVYVQATAVAAIVDTAEAEAAVPNLRSLYEAVGELSYLLSDDSLSRARIASTFALRQARDHLRTVEPPPEDILQRERELERRQEDIAQLERELDRRRKIAPMVHEAAMARGNYWITTSRTELVQQGIDAIVLVMKSKSMKGLGRQLYKYFSWDGHHVMASLLAVDTRLDSPTAGRVRRPGIFESPEEFIPELASVGLGGALKLYRQAFPETMRSTANE